NRATQNGLDPTCRCLASRAAVASTSSQNPQPSSCGNICHGMPLRRTKRMPMKPSSARDDTIRADYSVSSWRLSMLGWHISLHRLTDEVSIRRSFADARVDPDWKAEFDEGAVGERVAVRQAGVEGLKWIEQAADRDGGVTLSRNGYPNWYL